jgi:hypothetical protein
LAVYVFHIISFVIKKITSFTLTVRANLFKD